MSKIDGILLLDKPAGITSNAALQTVKHLYHAKKAGHTGSLDPIATGMLPICFGEATKFTQFLLTADKKYHVTAKLGIITASGDTDSPVLEKREVRDITIEKVSKVLELFSGTILQLPSMYSALKYKGKPLYKLARLGIEVEREPREVKIYAIKLLNLAEDLLTLEVFCSKGTYIRTLLADIGESLGCGAHVIALRRLEVGPFREQQMVSMPIVEDFASKNAINSLNSLLLPIESMFNAWHEVQLTDDMVYYLQQGNPLLIPNVPASGLVKLKSKSQEFLGVGEVLADGRVAPRRLMQKRG